MSVLSQVQGLPGVRAAKAAFHRLAFRGGWGPDLLPVGKVIDGSKSRDPGNAPDTWVLRAGVLMGKITASGKYAPSIIGSAAAYTSGDLTITVTPAAAAEIVRRVGATGSLTYIGPPTAGGTVASITRAYSAVNTTTGVITTADLGANLVSGSFVCAADGSSTPITLIPDGYGLRLVQADLQDTDIEFAEMPISGIVDSPAILPAWPSDTSLQRWICEALSSASGGKFTFTHPY